MRTSSIVNLSDAEKLEHVRAQVAQIEEETARAVLEYHGLPADPLAVRRLAYGRHLLMTLRLKEFVV